jgi:sugar-specific transcriptional regulator TrmB
MLDALRQLGWSEYEVRTYTALLRCAPATGYRAAREAAVPTAKIYEVLQRMEDRGTVRRLRAEPGGRTLYMPLSPTELVAEFRSQQERMLQELERELKEYIPRMSGLAAVEDWLEWEQSKQRRLLAPALLPVSPVMPYPTGEVN